MSARQKRKYTLLALSSILLVLALWISSILWRENIRKTADVPTSTSSIIVQQNGASTLEFVLRGDEWLLLNPEEQPVLEDRLLPFIQMATIPTDKAYTAADVDLSAAGLTNPLAIITIDGSDVALGEIDSSGERRYAMQNESVYFVPEWILSLIQGGPNAFIAAPVSQ